MRYSLWLNYFNQTRLLYQNRTSSQMPMLFRQLLPSRRRICIQNTTHLICWLPTNTWLVTSSGSSLTNSSALCIKPSQRDTESKLTYPSAGHIKNISLNLWLDAKDGAYPCTLLKESNSTYFSSLNVMLWYSEPWFGLYTDLFYIKATTVWFTCCSLYR